MGGMSIIPFANKHAYNLVAYQPGKPIEETAREIGMAPEDIVKLASNENPFGPSPRAVEAMAKAAAGTHIYPDGASFSLRSRLAELFGVDFNQTAVGSGSSAIELNLEELFKYSNAIEWIDVCKLPDAE